MLWVGFFLAVIVSAIATRMMIVYASRHLIDQINERSSHATPTPRGGGAGLVLGILLISMPIAYWFGAEFQVGILMVLITVMSALGWWDDHRNLSASCRLPVQLALVGAVCLACGFPSEIFFFHGLAIPMFSWWYFPLAILGGGWLVNLTNFMDGIDGIAGVQGVIGSIGLALLLPAEALAVRVLLIVCAGACVGFLIWNWSPAKIFMGDVGSTTLGFIFAIGVLEGLRHGVALELLILPLAPFVADATCTLVRRAWRRERLSQAHRSHLYQRMAIWWGAHRPVTILYGALALLGLALSMAAQQTYLSPGFGTLIWLVLWVLLVGYARRTCPDVTAMK